MTRTNDHRSRGFTLSELLVATAIFTIIIVAALLMYDRNQQVFKQSSEAADLQQNTRVAFNKLVADVRMAGFDFDRDGIPQLAGQAQQPDEQVEYANTSAVTIRGNFDYDAAQPGDGDNGREQDPTHNLESAKFPVVTTGNDEIVTYALKSKSGPNADKIELKIDISGVPRDGVEETYEIDQIDLTNQNPPYELQRIRFLKDKTIERTTIADNVRSLKFQYYRDPTGLSNEVTTMPLGADGGRDVRAGIRAIRVELIGMNAAKDAAYTNPTETAAATKNFRTYKLESLIVPRNLGLRGMVEPEIEPPQAPTVKGVCIGACGFAYVTWDPPAAGAPVNSYSVTWDESATGSFNNLTALGNVTAGWAGPMDPSKKYFFKVKSLNGYGSNASAVFPGSGTGIQPINKTKSAAPVLASVTPVAAGNQINVVWPTPITNVSGAYGNYGGSTSCVSPPSAATMPSKDEIVGYEVYRSTSSPVAIVAGNLIWNGRLSDTGAPITRADDGTVTFTDKTAKLNCVTYYYKVKAVEACAALPSGGDNDAAACKSDASNELSGMSTAKSVPATPTNLTILPTSGCGGGGQCTVNLQWNAVSKDTSTPAEDIQINRYRITRETWKSGSMQGSPATFDIDWATIAGPVTWTDNDPNLKKADAVGNLFQYKYTVKAMQCNDTSVSAASAVQTFPCANFTVDPPATGVMSGDGSAGNPYMMSGPVGSFGVTLSAPATTVTYTLTNMSTNVTSAPASATKNTATSYSVAVPLSGNDGTVYRLDVTVTDVANGCVTTNAPGTFITDSPNSSCCLRPYKLANGSIFDPSSPILVLNAAANTITVKVENDCDDPLEITAMTFSFEDGGNKKWGIKKITYTTPGGSADQDFGGTTFKTSPLTMTLASTHKLPAETAKRTIPANFNAQSYQMVLTMESSQNNPPTLTLDDLTGLCITYKDALGTTVQCRIAQQVSSNATCSP